MFQYTHRNHFKFGYNGDWFANRSRPAEEFTVAYGECTRRPGDFRSECIRAARLVRDSTELPLNVLFSGGADSEVVVRSFAAAGIATKISILRFRDGLNQHDIRYAIDFCEQAGLAFEFVDLDLLKFWENELFDYAEKSSCVSPQHCATMWLCDQVDGLPIIGAGECYLTIDYVDDYFEGRFVPGKSPYRVGSWDLCEREKDASWYRFLINTGRPGLGGFFQYTPELMYSFLADDWTRKLVRCEVEGEVENSNTKLAVYKRYFDLRDRPKYTGFEQVMDYDRIHRSELEALYPDSDQVAKTEYWALLKHLSSNGAPPDRKN